MQKMVFVYLADRNFLVADADAAFLDAVDLVKGHNEGTVHAHEL